MIPGEVRTGDGRVATNRERATLSLVVVNEGDRPIQVGSHLHFPDANSGLQFDRERAHGFRLDIPAGASVRFEPGVSSEVRLVALGGQAARTAATAEETPTAAAPAGDPLTARVGAWHARRARPGAPGSAEAAGEEVRHG